MTCIVGITDKEGVLMAADSMAVSAYTTHPRADKKLFTLRVNTGRLEMGREMLVGFTTSYRMGQLLRWWTPPARGAMDLEAYMSTKFVDGVRKHLKDGGFTTVSDNRESAGTFMVGYEGRLFEIHSDFQVAMPGLPYAAIGAGELIALGSLYTSESGTLSTEARAVMAIEAASQFHALVGGDVDVMRLSVVR